NQSNSLTAATNVVHAGLQNNNYFISFEITNIVNFGTKFKNRVRIRNIRIYWQLLRSRMFLLFCSVKFKIKFKGYRGIMISTIQSFSYV
ncbi:hypothetical protein BpHYR1_044570, partial [Brachionus plicatilis]